MVRAEAAGGKETQAETPADWVAAIVCGPGSEGFLPSPGSSLTGLCILVTALGKYKLLVPFKWIQKLFLNNFCV